MAIFALYVAAAIVLLTFMSSVAYGFDRVEKNEKRKTINIKLFHFLFPKKRGERSAGMISFFIQLWNFLIVILYFIMGLIDGFHYQKYSESLFFPGILIVTLVYLGIILILGAIVGIRLGIRHNE